MLQHLRAVLSWCDPDARLYYWRTATGMEVDFVVYSDTRFVAIEVKRKRQINARDLRGIQAFAADYPQAQRLVFYGGDRDRRINGIRIVPLAPGLAELERLLTATGPQ